MRHIAAQEYWLTKTTGCYALAAVNERCPLKSVPNLESLDFKMGPHSECMQFQSISNALPMCPQKHPQSIP